MFIRLVVFALISVIAIGCGTTPTEKPESTQGESQSVVESPKTTTAVPPTPLPPTAVPPTAVPTPPETTLCFASLGLAAMAITLYTTGSAVNRSNGFISLDYIS